ncbi:MAG TPA: hypothetical protein VGU03_15155 [Frateuria sp.]|uniref:hypothetical protein n=1 Tax=Frateuria sp. TaxID=2211372 RepID=UPI002DEB8E15|nr:hypothetical protein [Frateuria sp.]
MASRPIGRPSVAGRAATVETVKAGPDRHGNDITRRYAAPPTDTATGIRLISPEEFADYLAFLDECRPNLRSIARRTQGEHSAEDIGQEALLMAGEIRTRKGLAMRFADPGYRRLLLGYLFQHFVRYAETTVRYAQRQRRDADGEDAGFLIDALPSDPGLDPLHAWSEVEDARSTEPDPQQSQASAYLHLFGCCGNDTRRLADRLMISVSHCYRRLAQARTVAQWQHAMGVRCTDGDGRPLQPRTWRRFRYERRPLQLEFDFAGGLAPWTRETAT